MWSSFQYLVSKGAKWGAIDSLLHIQELLEPSRCSIFANGVKSKFLPCQFHPFFIMLLKHERSKPTTLSVMYLLTSDISLHGAWLRRGVGESSRLSWADEKGEKHIQEHFTQLPQVLNCGLPQHQAVGQSITSAPPILSLCFFSFLFFILSIHFQKTGRNYSLDWGKKRSGTKENFASHVWDKGSRSHLMNEGRERGQKMVSFSPR